jgi:hypothetical protein
MRWPPGRVVQNAAVWLVPVFSIVALVVMLSEPAAAQRPQSNRAAANPKVKVGEFAPDFELPRLTFKTDATGKTVGVISEKDTIRLSSFRGKKPVCLIMSSYT